MKKLLLPLCAALMVSNAAYADSYVRAVYSQANFDEQDLSITVAGGGGTLFFDGYDYGSSEYFSLAYGMSFSDKISAEIELAYPMSDKETDYVDVSAGVPPVQPGTFQLKAESLQLSINGVYRFMERKAGGLDPYVMAGIGFADNSIESQRVDVTGSFATVGDGDGTEFMYKFGAGLGYHINDKMTVDLSVTYVDAGSVESEKVAYGGGNPTPVPLSEALEFEFETINYGLGFSYAL